MTPKVESECSLRVVATGTTTSTPRQFRRLEILTEVPKSYQVVAAAHTARREADRAEWEMGLRSQQIRRNGAKVHELTSQMNRSEGRVASRGFF